MTIPWKTDKSLVSKPEFYVRQPREMLPRRFVPSHCIVSNMNISAGHQSKSRQQFIGIPFQRDPTDEQAQPTLHKYFSVLPLHISTSQSTFELILIQIHTQNFWSRFHDELLFVRFFLDHLCVPPWPPILTWSRVSRSTCETSLRSLLLPGWSYHTSVFHLLSSLAMLAAPS